MSRDIRLYLDDIVTSCEKIARFTQGAPQNAWLADEKTYDAVQRNLFVLGEAVKNVPPDIRD